MKLLKNIFAVLIIMLINSTINAQDNNSQSNRTAEQEAIRQTEKLQQELSLSSDQVKLVFDINLKYERERQLSNTRRQAMERIKNKDTDLQRVLTEEQYNRLQNMRQQRTRSISIDLNPSENSSSRLRSTYRRSIGNSSRSTTTSGSPATEKNVAPSSVENTKTTEGTKKQDTSVRPNRK